MTEYTLNQLSSFQLAELAYTSATYIAVITQSSVKIELHYIKGYFIEITYKASKRLEKPQQWQLYAANHFPDTPVNTHYLTIYLDQVSTPISKDSSHFDPI